MSSTDELDYSTLTWVKGEIQQNLDQTRQALEAYVENPSDTTQMRFCVTHLHQIQGTLQMVEVYGGALLADEMEQVATALQNDRIGNKEDAFEVLMRAILQLPPYLERLEEGHPDLPVALLPLLNDLRAARGAKLLSEGAFFAPDLAVKPPVAPAPEKTPPPLQAYAQKLRPVFQSALVGWYRNDNPRNSLQRILLVLRELEKSTTVDTARQLWWVGSGVVEALVDGGLETSTSVKLLVGQMDREIKRIIQEGEPALGERPPVDLLKNLLYYVGAATSQGPRVSKLRAAFRLQDLLPYAGKESAEGLRHSNRDLLQSVSAVVKEDLSTIKDQLDIFVRAKDRKPSDLEPLAHSLARISDTLVMLGLGDLHKVVQDQVHQINAITAKDTDPGDVALMEVASALLYVESALGTAGSQLPKIRKKTADAADKPKNILPENEYRQLIGLVIKESKELIITIKDSFNAFAADPMEKDRIANVPELLTQIKGVLSILSLDEAAALAHSAYLYITKELLTSRSAPAQMTLDRLADVITSIEYYLEAIEQSRAQPDSILNVARKSVAALGYAIAPQDVPAEGEFAGRAASRPAPQPPATPAPPVETRTVEKKPHLEVAPPPPRAAEPAKASRVVVAPPNAARLADENLEGLDQEILEIFLEEAGEVLQTISEQLDIWQNNSADREALTILRRSYHTMKGSGRMAGLTQIGEFAWVIEGMLNRVIEGRVAPGREMFVLLRETQQAMSDLIGRVKGEDRPRHDVAALAARAEALAEGRSEAQAPAAPPVAAAPAAPIYDPVLLDIFSREAAGHLDAIDQFLDDCGADPCTVTEQLTRALHTLHGSARMADVVEMAALSEALDRLFHALAERNAPAKADSLGLLREGVSALRATLHTLGAADAGVSEHTDLLERVKQLAAAIKAVPSAEAVTPAAPPVAVAPQPAPETLVLEAPAPAREPSFGEITAVMPAFVMPEEPGTDRDLVEIFVAEARDLLTQADRLLADWADMGPSPHIMSELQRALHTLKGGARMANVDAIADVSHELESLFEGIAIGRYGAPPSVVDFVRRCYDWLDGAVGEVANGGTPGPASGLLGQFGAHLQAPSAAPGEPASTTAAAHTAAPEAYDEDLLSIFLEEADEIQHATEDVLQQWGETVSDLRLVGELQRSLHTLKGGARMAGVNAIGDLSHSIESLLEAVTEKRIAPTADMVGLVQNCHDWLSDALEQLKTRSPLSPPRDLVQRLSTTLDARPGVRPSAAEPVRVEPQPAAPAPAVAAPPFAAAVPAAPVAAAAPDDGGELLGVFLDEADEICQTGAQTFVKWSAAPNNLALVEELQRALHTLKGGARMAGTQPIADVAHAMELVLEAIAEKLVKPGPRNIAVLQEALGWLQQTLQGLRKGQPLQANQPLSERLLALLTVVVDLPPAAAAPREAGAAVVPFRPEEAPGEDDRRTRNRAASEQVRVAADLLDALANHAGEINIYNARIAQQQNGMHFNLAELDQTVMRLREQLRKFEIEAETQIMYRHESKADSEQNAHFDPLELDRFSNMQQLSRSLVETLGDLTSIQDLMENLSKETDVLLLQQSRVNDDLQGGIMRSRLIPFSEVLPRLRRIVRQTGQELGRDAHLEVHGAEGEMDRTQLNRIVPALEHILRNAVSHGLEAPEVRKAKGKDPQGRIDIAFSREGSEVVLTIGDDGAGMNLGAIRKKAVERGLMAKNAPLTDREVLQFVLESGFSTAETVTQISGRGVGMDVVNTEVKQLGGTLSIDTVPDKGTKFVLRLPLTLLVNHALMVSVGDTVYAIQLSNIEHVLRVDQKTLVKLLSGAEKWLEYADHRYEYLNLGQVLHGKDTALPGDDNKHPLLLGRSGDHRVAMHVDALIGRQEIVIKSVGPQLSSINSISGATILPNGEIALILDIGAIVRNRAALQQASDAGALLEAGATPEKRALVMIVDDSITVRKVTERLLKRHDYNTLTAKDGVDALTIMLEQVPDIMLLDVEMPRMDGYELATTMRNDARLKSVPIIMITSRTGDKHRARAMSIGVNIYMGKPYQEQALLENIQSLLNQKA